MPMRFLFLRPQHIVRPASLWMRRIVWRSTGFGGLNGLAAMVNEGHAGFTWGTTDAEGTEVDEMRKTIEWVKNHKPHTAVILILVIAGIAVSIAAASGAFAPQDKPLKGDAGQRVLDQSEQNTEKVLEETEPEETQQQDDPDAETETAVPSPPAQSGNVGNGNTNTGTHAGNSGGNSGANTGNSGGNTSTNGGSAGGNSGNASQPTHTHTWVDHTATKQVWVSNMVTVPDYETKTIYGARFYIPNGDGSYIAKGPTYWFEDGFTIDDLKEIIKNALKNADENGLYNGVYYGNYQNVTKTEQVQVGSHQEDQGHYETQTYVDYQYCVVCGQHK